MKISGNALCLSILLAWALLLQGCGGAAVAPIQTTTAPSDPAPTGSPPPQPTQVPATPVPSPTLLVPSPLPTTTPALQPTLTPTPTPSDLAAAIEAYIASYDSLYSPPFSGAVLLARQGQVLYSGGFGLANQDAKIPNTPHTRFRIGSLTKAFTSMAIFMLQERGNLSVSDSLCSYIDDCPAAWGKVRLYHLLAHTSGIPNYTSLYDIDQLIGKPVTPQVVIGRLRSLPLAFQPGERFAYSNSGYYLLGQVIEKVSGQSYDQFLGENIFKPLDMQATSVGDGSQPPEQNAAGYTVENKKMRVADPLDLSWGYAAGGMVSSVEDLLKWDQALYTEKLLPRSALEQIFTERIRDPETERGYGYGWYLSQEDGRRLISHGSAVSGFVGELRRYPDDGVTVIVLCNQEMVDVRMISRDLAALVFQAGQ